MTLLTTLTEFWYISGGDFTPNGAAVRGVADIFNDREVTLSGMGLDVMGWATLLREPAEGIEGRTNASEPGASTAPTKAR